MQTLQDAGRIALAKSLAAMPCHIAWGRGDGQWQVAPANPTDRTALRDEIGRRTVVDVGYARPGTLADHDIELPGPIYYKTSAEPTPYLVLRTTFAFADAEGETVRECGVFFGTVAKPEVPAGKRYLTPGEIENPGTVYCLENRPPVLRSGTTKATEEIVIPL
ncbi:MULTISPECIES: hypothetical protein [Delftia]|jgi:hypothetical protein|uniref:hypothetical protein n=1 Tax=Delftia TaxID=80865 RepID=UPI00105612F0|nr:MULTISPECIES: hypothetical protein [Delftia]MDH1827011.1 hypothetical protein [Delftia tsuruhatensis]MDR0204372.1 hypothetical protein [Delftia acidovorans]TDF27242.1 hypothetical protein EZI45_16665 [Delftia tsuruhatensis]